MSDTLDIELLFYTFHYLCKFKAIPKKGPQMKETYKKPYFECFSLDLRPLNLLETFSLEGDADVYDFSGGGEMPNSED